MATYGQTASLTSFVSNKITSNTRNQKVTDVFTNQPNIFTADNTFLGDDTFTDILIQQPDGDTAELTFNDTNSGNGPMIISKSTDGVIATTANDKLLLKTNNTNRVEISSDGLVGIGKTPANSKQLDVNVSARISGTGANLEINNGSSDLICKSGEIGTSSTNTMAIKTNNTNRINLLSSGEVGINKIPDSNINLDVQKNLRISGDANSQIEVNNGSSDLILKSGEINSTNTLSLKTNNSEKLHIAQNGNVGINVTPSSYKFQVNGTGLIDDFLMQKSDANFSYFRNITSSKMVLGANNSNIMTIDGVNSRVGVGVTPTTTLDIYNATDNILNIGTGASNSNGSLQIIKSDNGKIRTIGADDLIFDTNSAERMRITSTGDIGIGINTPKAGLQVFDNNGALISSAVTSGNRTAILRFGSPYATNHDAYCAKITSTNNQSANYNANLQFHTSQGNDASAPVRMSIQSNGYVAVGGGTALAKLQIYGDEGLTVSSSTQTGNRFSTIRLGVSDSANSDVFCSKIQSVNNKPSASSNDYNTDLRFTTSNANSTSGNEVMRLTSNGSMCINPQSLATSEIQKARLYVNGPDVTNGGSYLELSSISSFPYIGDIGQVVYYNYPQALMQDGFINDSGGISPSTVANLLKGTSIYSSDNIITRRAVIVSEGTFTASDSRIKTNIQDLSNNNGLDLIRQLQVKKYNYKDTVSRGTKDVFGFIAQDVKQIIPEATYTRTEEIPNVFSVAEIKADEDGSYNILEFTSFDTSSLDASSNVISIYDKNNSSHKMTFTIINNKKIQVDGNLETICSCYDSSMNIIEKKTEPILDASGNTTDVSGNTVGETEPEIHLRKVFVFGQVVNDFHVIKKEMIFGIGIQAIKDLDQSMELQKQEVDTLKSRLTELEADVAEILSSINL